MSLAENDNRTASLLDEVVRGDAAEHALFELIYDELRDAARDLMRRRRPDTLTPTALVNEVAIRILQRSNWAGFQDSSVFLAVAVRAMNQVLVDHHRRRTALKRRGGREREPLDLVLESIKADAEVDFLDLNDALDKLKQENERQYDVVRYRFFGGLTIQKTAELLNVSVGSVERDWRIARLKLYRQLRNDSHDDRSLPKAN